jgi:hypothetical protein
LETKEYNMTITKGYIGTELVTAFTYQGADAGLNHYQFQGKTFAGTVKFNYIILTETV